MRQTLLTAMLGVLLSATANASTFYIDEFRVVRNNNLNWFVDSFSDGNPPPSSEASFPDGSPGSYGSFPDPLPGPEENGRLALDTALGASTNNVITGQPILFQRARLFTNTDDNEPTRGLKTNHTFNVQGLFDLARPQLVGERYGVRFTDFKGGRDANDLVNVSVTLDDQNDWLVQFREADFDAGVTNVLDSWNLGTKSNIGVYDQIRLLLTKNATDSNVINAGFQLIDWEDSGNNELIYLNGDPTIFDGENWTRAGFFAAQVVPIPPALPLFVSAMGLIGVFARKRRQAA